MKLAPSYRLLLLLSLLLSAPACARAQKADRPQQTTPRRVAVRAARMLDVARGQLVADAVVVVKGERIVAAGSRVSVPAGFEVIDLGDATILPGLIDAHTHITYHFDETGHFGIKGDAPPAVTLKYAAESARRTLEAGFTTIRNLGAGGRVDLQLRDAIRRGELPGPRLLASGLPLTADEVYDAATPAARVARIREFVRDRVAEGADVIKIFEGVGRDDRPVFSREEIAAAVEEAARANLKVAVHAHEAAAVKAAVEGGCASVEHGTFLDDEAVRLLVKHHTALVPTLYLPTHYLSHKEQFSSFGDATWEFFERLKSHNLENLRRARQAGVWVVAGSDAVAGLHGENAREVVWLTKAGMTPAEAIRAATLDAARLLGMEGQAGELKEGTFADVVAVAGDPLRDAGALERVVFVMKSGAVFKNTVAKTGER
jgi:imidazolonepropionase-like amidohydrolase